MRFGIELRHAFRRLWLAPGFSATAILTLTLGIGATTALFSVFNGIVLRPLPYGEPDRLVVIWIDDVKRQLHTTLVSDPVYRDWQEQAASFAEMGFSTRNTPVTLTGGPDPERLDAARSSASMFSTLGAIPVTGRVYSAEEEHRRERLVVLRAQLAARLFGTPTGAVGKSTQIDGQPFTVVGVLPNEFHFPAADVQLWMPLGEARARVAVVGRLRPGVTHAAARNEMAAIAGRLAQKYPERAADPDFPGFTANVVPVDEHATGRDVRTALMALMAAALLVLLIACANVANLLVARGSSRQRELAVRTALGASRMSLIRHVLSESLLLASAAGVLGLTFADWLVRVVVKLAPATLPRVDSVSVDGPVIVVTLIVVFVSGVTFGGLSAWQMNDLDPDRALREGGRSQGAGVRHRRVQRLLIAGELALTLTLLAGAGLLLRSLELVARTPLGFDPQNLLAFRVVVADGLTNAQRANFYRAAIDRIRAVPSVTAVGVTSNLFATSAPDTTILPEGQPPGVGAVMVADDAVNSEFFRALRVPLRRGRLFSTADLSVSQHVAIVNEAFARHFWPGEDPIGDASGSATIAFRATPGSR